jgi:PPOX class probable F420-dependent enzyme
MVPESHKDILGKKGLAHIATIGPGGEPQSTPVWYGWDGESLKFSNTKARQKYKNLKRNPHVAVSITDPDNPYRYLELRGIAEIEDDTDRSFVNEMARKYMGRDYPYTEPGEERVIVKIRPLHTTCQG